MSLKGKNVGVLGLGTMGRAVATGLLRSGNVGERLRATVRHAEHAAPLQEEFQIEVGTDNARLARASDVLLLCTKPHVILDVVRELARERALDHDPLVISIAAGVPIARLQEAAARELALVRAMPNTPCLIGEGMSVLSAGPFATPAALDVAEAIFRPLGRVLQLDEEHMNAVTGLSASGPGFVYVIIEALAEGGVMMGLPRPVATELAAQAVQGAARMVLVTGRHPAALKDEVTTPAGCTISALLALEDGKLRSVLARGVEAASRAAAGLGQN